MVTLCYIGSRSRSDAALCSRTPTFPRTILRPCAQNPRSENISLPDGARCDDLITESIRERMHGAPTGAMSGANDVQLKFAHGLDGLPGKVFVHTGEMEATDHAINRRPRCFRLRALQHIDDAGMRASRFVSRSLSGILILSKRLPYHRIAQMRLARFRDA